MYDPEHPLADEQILKAWDEFIELNEPATVDGLINSADFGLMLKKALKQRRDLATQVKHLATLVQTQRTERVQAFLIAYIARANVPNCMDAALGMNEKFEKWIGKSKTGKKYEKSDSGDNAIGKVLSEEGTEEEIR